MEESKKIISKEDIQNLLESVSESKKLRDTSKLNVEKVEEIIRSFEGESKETVILAICTPLLLLSSRDISRVIEMAKSAFGTKIMVETLKRLEE